MGSSTLDHYGSNMNWERVDVQCCLRVSRQSRGSQGLPGSSLVVPTYTDLQHEDEVCIRSHNSLATSQSLIYLLTEARATQSGQAPHVHPSNERPRLGYASFPLATVENGWCVWVLTLFTTRTVFLFLSRKNAVTTGWKRGESDEIMSRKWYVALVLGSC